MEDKLVNDMAVIDEQKTRIRVDIVENVDIGNEIAGRSKAWRSKRVMEKVMC